MSCVIGKPVIGFPQKQIWLYTSSKDAYMSKVLRAQWDRSALHLISSSSEVLFLRIQKAGLLMWLTCISWEIFQEYEVIAPTLENCLSWD